MSFLSARGLRSVLVLSGALLLASAAGAQQKAKTAKKAPAATAAAPVYRVAAQQQSDNSWGFLVYKNNVAVHGQDKAEGTRKGYADKAAAEAAANAYVRRLQAEEKQ